LEGRLYIKSVLGLPWKGWKLCVVTLQGTLLHYVREESTVTGDIRTPPNQLLPSQIQN